MRYSSFVEDWKCNPYLWLSKRQIAPQPQPRPNGFRLWKPLGKLVESMRQATGHKRVTLDSAFHEALIQCSANRLFAVLQKAVSSLCEAAIENVLTAATDAQWQTLVDCHETICQSLLNRDAQAGMAAIDQHYTQPFSGQPEHSSRVTFRRTAGKFPSRWLVDTTPTQTGI